MNSSDDFLVLNKEGLSFIPLGNTEKRRIQVADGIDRMVHSLASCNYLKIEDTNYIHFIRPKGNSERRHVGIEQQFVNSKGDTNFEGLYRITLDEMTLVELILIQSIFACENQEQITKLIELQPDSKLFFKSFMELDKSNMLSILSFDSRCIN